jgi:hypothetical protein
LDLESLLEREEVISFLITFYAEMYFENS